MNTSPHHPRREYPGYPADESEYASSEFVPGSEQVDSTMMAVLKLVGVFVVIGVAIFLARNYFGAGSAQADIGRCAKLSGSAAEAEIEFRDCRDADASYVVAQRLDGSDADCASTDYTGYFQTGDDAFTLCLRLNIVEGDCVNGTLSGAIAKVACTAAADFRVDRIVRGTADRAACGAAPESEDKSLVYPKPDPMTLCLVRRH
ncbi:LppU/SCO3897 family protein [Nocardia bovistercoris]|uniref:Uncharacterized protein n=1 Tax=Nocardia bovistercoris TaxID=2785916 RepID=A0A931N302_9NOCA|nr:hypothetical protein [Nocardia bovistercoris]MBH0777394.1 hypothetical protein [Nocardia bovistercoris]